MEFDHPAHQVSKYYIDLQLDLESDEALLTHG